MAQRALLLIAHGSRRAEANADLVTLAEMVRARQPADVVEIAYLELASPSIPEGAEQCVAHPDITEVRLVPYFLSPGRHVAEDLEEYRQQFTTRWPHIQFHVCAPLGLHPHVVDALLERANEGYRV
ncbi:MAG: CbiX/SirB N-terminal domain-containing protein [Planctomycetaceae bacterium]|nr:CbiX/SirB N-terminal domain-containing protein [Planctomycetaceae bacterium]